MHRNHTEGSLSEPLLSLDNDGRASSSSSHYHRRHTSSGMGFTWKHILYLVVMMMFGAALLDAIINGGLAALMYHDQVRDEIFHNQHRSIWVLTGIHL